MSNPFSFRCRLFAFFWIGLFHLSSVTSSLAIGGDEILPLSLHGVAETDPVLSDRYYDVDGFYSFRPPVQWRRDAVSPRGGEKEPWRWRVSFGGKGPGESLEVGVGLDGPSSLEKTVLSRYMGDLIGGLRRSGVHIDESGLYLYDRYHCILVKGREKGRSTVWLLVFNEEPVGEHLRLVMRAGSMPPQRFERLMEAVLSSIRWPDLKRGKDDGKNVFPETSR